MKFKKSKKDSTYSIEGITLGQLMAIRNGLGYAVQAGIATPVQNEVYFWAGRFLAETGNSIPDVAIDTARFLRDHFSIGSNPG